MDMGLQSLSFENRFSTLWRCLYMFYSILRGVFALLLAEYGGNATLNQGRMIGVAAVTFVAQKRAQPADPVAMLQLLCDRIATPRSAIVALGEFHRRKPRAA